MQRNSIWLRACSSVLIASLLFVTPGALEAGDLAHGKRPVTVADSVELTTLVDADYFAGEPSVHAARFSPDGRRFIVAIRKASIARNQNDFSILLFRTSTLFQSSKPKALVTMSSSDNDDAIKNIKWLSSNRSIVFLGRTPSGVSAVFSLDVAKGKLGRLTPASESISNYDASENGRVIVFTSKPGSTASSDHTTEHPTKEIVIQKQNLLDALADSCPSRPYASQLFLQTSGKKPILIPIEDQPREEYQINPISVSPDGRYALVDTYVREIPTEWLSYRNQELRTFVRERREGEASRLRRFLLLDTRTSLLSPLLDAPMESFQSPTWSRDSASVLLQGTYLPVGLAHKQTREDEQEQTYDVEINLPSRRLHIASGTEFRRVVSADQYPVRISVQEDVNRPPKLYAQDPKTRRTKLLLDLNPQLADLDLGCVEVIRWKDATGRESEGGLYLPPNYQPGKRYPVVIQTHGFTSDRFSMDGRLEWSSAFAARPMASRNILVLQTPMFADSTVDEGPHELARYLGAIDYLDQRGLIDRGRVGIVGFSRTVFEVAYALTHSSFHFAAASLVDGIDGGYFQYIAFGPRDNGFVNGADPFGKGLQLWLHNSPGFNLDRVTSPVRILALGPWSLIGSWEWFSGLTLLNRPVDFVYLRDAAHMTVRPQERVIAEQDLVDWFCFWLKGEERSNDNRPDEYVRWRKLRELIIPEPVKASGHQLPQ